MSDLILDIETSGLSPLKDRISCICVEYNHTQLCFSGDFEKKILEDFVAFCKDKFLDKLVSYNGWSFDIPFIRVRAMVNKVKLPSYFWDDKKICDPYNILMRSKSGKQCEFGNTFGIKTIGTGLECLDYLAKGDFVSIEKHCKSDINVLSEIYYRMKEAGY
jgi:hypothetical protein